MSGDRPVAGLSPGRRTHPAPIDNIGRRRFPEPGRLWTATRVLAAGHDARSVQCPTGTATPPGLGRFARSRPADESSGRQLRSGADGEIRSAESRHPAISGVIEMSRMIAMVLRHARSTPIRRSGPGSSRASTSSLWRRAVVVALVTGEPGVLWRLTLFEEMPPVRTGEGATVGLRGQPARRRHVRALPPVARDGVGVGALADAARPAGRAARRTAGRDPAVARSVCTPPSRSGCSSSCCRGGPGG